MNLAHERNVWRDRAVDAEEEVDRLRVLLKQAHDRDKFQGEPPTIKWYAAVALYFEERAR